MPLKKAKRAGVVWPQEENPNGSVILWIICNVFKIFPEWQPRSLFKLILTFSPMFFISTALKSICYFISWSLSIVNWLGTDRIRRNFVGKSLGILVDKLSMSQHGTLAVMKANCIVQRWREVFFFFLFSTFGATGVLCPFLCSAKGHVT